MFEKITYISNSGCTIKLFDNANITINKGDILIDNVSIIAIPDNTLPPGEEIYIDMGSLLIESK